MSTKRNGKYYNKIKDNDTVKLAVDFRKFVAIGVKSHF